MKNEKIAVKCKNKKEHNIVYSYATKLTIPRDIWTDRAVGHDMSINNCITLDGEYDSESYYIGKSYKIINFEEFEREYLKIKPTSEIELIKDKWYEGKWFNSKYLFKFNQKIGSKIYVNAWICVNSTPSPTIIENESFADITSDCNIQLANMEEVFKYFPEERPKIYVPQIGDYITTEGTAHLAGRIMIGKYETEYCKGKKDSERAEGPLISDFNAVKTGNLAFNKVQDSHLEELIENLDHQLLMKLLGY